MKDLAASVVLASLDGDAVSSAERAFFESYQPAGVTLFARNVPKPYTALTALNASLQDLSRAEPFIVAIDQEGGRVSRLPEPFPNRGPAMALEEGSMSMSALDRIEAYGQEVGNALRELGVNVNFAPVADVLVEPTNTAIGDRAFGDDATPVRMRAEAFLDGMQSVGVKGCAKHFPGQGAALVDTHEGEAVVDVEYVRLYTREIAAFIDLMRKAPMVMMSHCRYPALDEQRASQSEKIIRGVLQKELGFQGLVVSDDMVMGAVPQSDAEWQQSIVAAVAAGTDLVLVCKGLERAVLAIDALEAEATRNQAFADRLEDAAARVRGFRKTLVN